MIRQTSTKLDILSILDVVFAVNGEMIQGNGEDSYGFSFNKSGGILAVFDGCGGLGSKRYEHYGLKTGAYIASRVACEILLRNWYCAFATKNIKIDNKSINQSKLELLEAFKLGLGKYKASASPLVKGSMTREFPTTASIIMCDYEKNKLNMAFVWAGDSRGYVLTSTGLAQITSDDLAGDNDAYANLSSDARLENVIAADGKFRLNHKLLSVPTPFMAITATDGCFGYFKTPMEFEYMLIETLLNAKNVSAWRANLFATMDKVAGDDFSLGIAAFGYASFEKMQKSLLGRGKLLYQKYISKLNDATNKQIAAMWQEYRKDYYRW